eukprot:CAMPEP_0183306660 /NCGR_PEP_ID=MMETSP0160_2-20130417/13512_1 /TAXON_ID=2839 ORGANISM="Odontella Sinensis, Strain Grunow 1884" /NCGR_SAMPLE_ID=MMETSP0160_2 /ASSEMBLY_ACC=CAM_ASM_000250 /LENGTH=62 /DNA_ID=CAMNT_0025470097 /DNA_START=70 /DNA_END=255 /DNA_ORIENTATION=-
MFSPLPQDDAGGVHPQQGQAQRSGSGTEEVADFGPLNASDAAMRLSDFASTDAGGGGGGGGA